jgi:hypothetical protein
VRAAGDEVGALSSNDSEPSLRDSVMGTGAAEDEDEAETLTSEG